MDCGQGMMEPRNGFVNGHLRSHLSSPEALFHSSRFGPRDDGHKGCGNRSPFPGRYCVVEAR